MPKTKTCSSCQQQIDIGHVFCMHCGTNQEKEASCPTCHSPLAGDTNFCNQCGNKTTQKSKSSNINAILVILLTVIVISLTLRIPIQRVLLFFIPVVIVWAVHSLLKKIEGS